MADDEIRRALAKLQETTEHNSGLLEELVVTVRGDKRYGARGLVLAVDELVERVKALERFRDRVFWMAIGAGAASGGGVWLLLEKIFGGL